MFGGQPAASDSAELDSLAESLARKADLAAAAPAVEGSREDDDHAQAPSSFPEARDKSEQEVEDPQELQQEVEQQAQQDQEDKYDAAAAAASSVQQPASSVQQPSTRARTYLLSLEREVGILAQLNLTLDQWLELGRSKR